MSLAERWHCLGHLDWDQLPLSGIRCQCCITQPPLFITSHKIFHYASCAAVLVGSMVMVTIVSELTESFRSSGYLGLCPEEHFHPYCFFLVLQWLCSILFQFRSLLPWEISCNYSLFPPESPRVSFEFYGKHEQLP